MYLPTHETQTLVPIERNHKPNPTTEVNTGSQYTIRRIGQSILSILLQSVSYRHIGLSLLKLLLRAMALT